MKVYYAHSKLTYDTIKESRELAYLRKNYDEVVDPNELGELGSLQAYLDIVKTCDKLVCSSLDGFVGRGVFEEVSYALDIGLPVYGLSGAIRNRVTECLVKKVVVIDPNDWILCYGEVQVCA